MGGAEHAEATCAAETAAGRGEARVSA